MTDAAESSRRLRIAVRTTWVVALVSLVYSWLILGLSSNAVCEAHLDPAAESSCFDRYQMWWAVVLGLHLVGIVGGLVFGAMRARRWWGIGVALLGTLVPAAVFTVAWNVPL